MDKFARKTHQTPPIATHTPIQGANASYATLQPNFNAQGQPFSHISPANVMTLQRSIGNRAVTQMLTAHAMLQRAAAAQQSEQADGTVDRAQESQIHTPQDSGQPVPKAVRAQVEQQTGADLSAVKVHSNPNSHTLNRQFNARAFTHQNNIFLGKGESPHDVQLMAHELTHTIQQRGGQSSGSQQIQRKVSNLHIDKRIRRKNYDKGINPTIKRIRFLLEKYNAIPLAATNYQEQLDILDEISSLARGAYHHIGSGAFMNKKWRKLGGPFRMAYYMLQRNLSFIAKVDNGGFVGAEMDAVKQQMDDPINQVRVRRENEFSQPKNNKQGGQNETPNSEQKYDFRQFDRYHEEVKKNTFTAPSNIKNTPLYTPLGRILASSISPGDKVTATGHSGKVTIKEEHHLGGEAYKQWALTPGRTILMYEVKFGGIPKAMIPASIWDHFFGANSYPVNTTEEGPKKFTRWIERWERFGDGTRNDDYTEDAKNDLAKLNSIGLTDEETRSASNIEIPDELYNEGGFQMSNSQDELTESNLQIPSELENEGGFSLL